MTNTYNHLHNFKPFDYAAHADNLTIEATVADQVIGGPPILGIPEGGI